MATLALFSTITQQANAQKTSTASMTIRASVQESVSLLATNEMKFAESSTTANGFQVTTEQSAGFSILGSADLEVTLRFKAPEKLVSVEGSSVYFKPLVKIGNQEFAKSENMGTQLSLKQQDRFGKGEASVWIEGILQSDEDIAKAKYNGDYIVLVDYN